MLFVCEVNRKCSKHTNLVCVMGCGRQESQKRSNKGALATWVADRLTATVND